MADFYKVHERRLSSTAQAAVADRRPFFRIAAFSPMDVIPSSEAAIDEMTWIIEFALSDDWKSYRPTKSGNACIEAWRAKYKNEPDWRFGLPGGLLK